MPDITIPEEAARAILLAMNPVIEYPGSSMIQRARRLRYHVETRGWEYTEQHYPEVGRMRVELAAGLAAELMRLAEDLTERADKRVADSLAAGERECDGDCESSDCHAVSAVAAYSLTAARLRRRAAELRGGTQ